MDFLEITDQETNGFLKIRAIQIEKAGEYVHPWFTQNRSKPPVKIPQVDDAAGSRLRSITKGFASGVICSVQTASAFLSWKMKSMTARLDSVWKSYNQVIGGPNTDITPLSLLSVEEAGAPLISGNEISSSEADEKWIVGYILCLYRLGRVNDANYRGDLIKSMKPILEAQGMPNTANLLADCGKTTAWCQCPVFKKLVAAIDMFFYRFPDHEWSFVRIGTISSRYKDCTSLLSVAHISRLLGLPHPAELWIWITNLTLHHEMKRMFNNEDEFHDPYSYFPYQIEMGLTKKSLYSTRENPGIHAFCHIIGLYYQNARSMKARWMLEDDVNPILFNAHLVGFAFTRGKWADKFWAVKGHIARAAPLVQQPQNNQQEQMEEDINDDEIQSLNNDGIDAIAPPDERTPQAWTPYLDAHNWTMSPAMVRTAKLVASGIVVERDNTIAKFSKTPAFYLNMD
uniref:Nucleoprotein n=1 Tax=Wuhan House Fly Virus 1 TaxID=1608104 RepID=A0A1L3KN62_9RHAB|nr:putative nucleoprotein [Wuhan House Fly Virus 1]